MIAVLRAREIVPPPPRHLRRGQQRLLLVGGRAGRVRVGGREEQQLRSQRRAAPISGHERDSRREVRARAVAADGDADPAACHGSTRGEPARGLVRGLGGGGERMLGRERVVERQHRARRRVRERAAQVVGTVEVAEDPRPAMQVQQDRRSIARRVETRAQWTGARRDREILDATDRFARTLKQRATRDGRRARFGYGDRVQPGSRSEPLDDLAQPRLESEIHEREGT